MLHPMRFSPIRSLIRQVTTCWKRFFLEIRTYRRRELTLEQAEVIRYGLNVIY